MQHEYSPIQWQGVPNGNVKLTTGSSCTHSREYENLCSAYVLKEAERFPSWIYTVHSIDLRWLCYTGNLLRIILENNLPLLSSFSYMLIVCLTCWVRFNRKGRKVLQSLIMSQKKISSLTKCSHFCDNPDSSAILVIFSICHVVYMPLSFPRAVPRSI